MHEPINCISKRTLKCTVLHNSVVCSFGVVLQRASRVGFVLLFVVFPHLSIPYSHPLIVQCVLSKG